MWTQVITTEDLLQCAGIAGFFCYIIGFLGLQLGKVDGNGNAYTLWSMMGASLVLISLIGAFNLASLMIQVSWLTIGAVGLIRRALNRNAKLVKTPETTGHFHANSRIQSHPSA